MNILPQICTASICNVLKQMQYRFAVNFLTSQYPSNLIVLEVGYGSHSSGLNGSRLSWT